MSTTHEFFNVLEKLVEIDEGEFTLDVSVFTEVAASVGLLCSERFLNAEHVAETGETRFEVQLRRLREVGLFAVVVEAEQGRASLDLSLNHARGSDLEEVQVGVRLSERGEKGSPDLEDGRRVLATDDEVSRIGEEGGIGILWRDAE